MPDEPPNHTHAVIEQRIYRIECIRGITEDCTGEKSIYSYGPDGQAPRSLTAAVDFFREKGWTIHTNGTATCGPCRERWENPPEPKGEEVPADA